MFSQHLDRAGPVDQSEFEQIVRAVTEEVVRYLGAPELVAARWRPGATTKFAPTAT